MTSASDVFVDWIHPSVRDTVIEYLNEHDQERLRFLAHATARGALLALSTGGGASGRRSFPLLRSDDDWAALEAVVAELARHGSEAEQTTLLRGINDASIAPETIHLGLTGRVSRLGRELLDGLRESWSANGTAIDRRQLETYYALSVNVRYLVPSPELDATWSNACLVADEVIDADELSDEDARAVKDFAALVRLIKSNEPRYFAIFGVSQVDSRLQCFSQLIVRQVSALQELPYDEDVEYDDGQDGPVEPDYAESAERRWLKATMEAAEELIEVDLASTRELVEVSAQMEDHAAVREYRHQRYEEWERRGDDDDGSWSVPRAQGAGDFDLVAFFSDL